MTSRRSLITGLGATALFAGLGSVAHAQPRMPAALIRRSLKLQHLHTGEAVDIVYHQNGRYLPDALATMNRFLRDHRDGSVHPIDVELLDFLHDLTVELGTSKRIGIVCGYRSPRSNEFLRKTSTGVAKHSLHLEGRAVDIRIPGMRVKTVAEAALDMRLGGVGKYTRSNFVHLDTGRFRTWGA